MSKKSPLRQRHINPKRDIIVCPGCSGEKVQERETDGLKVYRYNSRGPVAEDLI